MNQINYRSYDSDGRNWKIQYEFCCVFLSGTNCQSVRMTLLSPSMNNNQKGGTANHCKLDVLSDMLF